MFGGFGGGHFAANLTLTARLGCHEAGMVHGFLRTLVKVAVASLIVGTVLNHFGVTPDVLAQKTGLSQDQLIELGRKSIDWALPNLFLGSLVIIPVWFVVYLFRPPRPHGE